MLELEPVLCSAGELEARCAGGRREGGAPARECLGGGAPVRRGGEERRRGRWCFCSVIGIGMGSRRRRDARAGFTGGLGGRRRYGRNWKLPANTIAGTQGWVDNSAVKKKKGRRGARPREQRDWATFSACRIPVKLF